MKSLDLNTTNFLIIVGSFNNEYNLGFNLYQLNPAEKAIIHKNQNIEAINSIHFQFSNNKRILYSTCASGEDEGKIATFEIDLMKKPSTTAHVLCWICAHSGSQFFYQITGCGLQIWQLGNRLG